MIIAAIIKLITWLGSLFTGLWTAIIAIPAYASSVHFAAEALARIVRAGLAITVLLVLVNSIVPNNLSTLTLWNTYATSAGSVLQYVGYFVPLDLLFSLLDLYIFGILVLLMFRLVSWLDAKAK